MTPPVDCTLALPSYHPVSSDDSWFYDLVPLDADQDLTSFKTGCNEFDIFSHVFVNDADPFGASIDTIFGSPFAWYNIPLPLDQGQTCDGTRGGQPGETVDLQPPIGDTPELTLTNSIPV